jgi:hypothetical protein
MMAGVRRTVKIMTKKDTMIPQMHDWKKHDVIRKRGDLKGATKVPFLIIFSEKIVSQPHFIPKYSDWRVLILGSRCQLEECIDSRKCIQT